MNFCCSNCNRSFDRAASLQQHMRDATVHALPFACGLCQRSFGNQYALEQHQRHSPAHVKPAHAKPAHATLAHAKPAYATPAHACNACDRAFHSRAALEQHQRHLPAHGTGFCCSGCDRAFGSAQARDQHMRDSAAHRRPQPHHNRPQQQQRQQPAAPKKQRESPLDAFFRSFSGFRYDASLPPATSYAYVRRYMNWRPQSPQSREMWNEYQCALGAELRMWFGGDDEDLGAWHALCRAVGVSPLPKTCAQCQEALRKVHVNIVDLVEWGRSDRTRRVQCFRTVNGLRAYTHRTGKVFRNTLDQEDDNVVLRHLLRKLFVET